MPTFCNRPTSGTRSVFRRLLALGLMVPLSVLGGFFGDPEANWVEGPHVLPEPPGAADLRAFDAGLSGNRFMVDERSISVGDDGVVRYTLVVEASGGARNVTFEGVRCVSGSYRIYAIGGHDGRWREARNSEWAPIAGSTHNRPRAALAFDHFCDDRVPPRNRDDALRRLRAAPSLPTSF